MEAAATTGHDATTTLFAVKEEPLDFDMMVKVEAGDLELDLSPPTDDIFGNTVTVSVTATGGTGSVVESVASPKKSTTTTSKTKTATTTSSSSAAATAVPQIGSSNSAFQPYKQQSLTILTNLQRGNVKTTNKENGPESLTFHEKAAKASLTDADITESNVNAKDPNGFTPLMWAAFHGRLSIVQKLVEKGAQLDTYGPEGETALMFAASNGHTEVLSYLLSKGAEPDVEDDAGNTALMFASYGNHADCVNQLLRHGANMSKSNGIGDTPFEIAINKGHLAAQYAMEDFLKEEIEMSISDLSTSETTTNTTTTTTTNNSTISATETKLSNNTAFTPSCNSTSSGNTFIISNGTCNTSGPDNNIISNGIILNHCNGIGGSLLLLGGSAAGALAAAAAAAAPTLSENAFTSFSTNIPSHHQHPPLK